MLFMDLETSAIDNAADFVRDVDAPSNYKSAEAVAKYKAEAKASAIEKAALDPWLLRIVAFGYAVDDEPARAIIAKNEGEEMALLVLLWDAVRMQINAGDTVIGWNLLNFDLTAAITRSRLLGVKPAFSSLKKYNQFGVTDLMLEYSFNGLIPNKSMAFVCQRFGIPDTDTISGKDIPALVASQQWDLVEAHVLADINKTRQLANRIGLVKF